VTHIDRTSEDGNDWGRLSHDLLSPLAVIVGYAELLRTRKDERFLDEAVEGIIAATFQLKGAVQTFVSKAEAFEKPRPERVVDVRSRMRLVTGRPRRIVLVDDDPLVRRLLRTTLPAESFDVVEAPDGETALRLVGGRAAALMVLDWHLPARSGAEVLAESKSRFPAMPVLVLTAAHDPEQRSHAARLGADVFLTKPFSPSELLAAIERLLGERPVDQQA
jgi:CheY-like chemotaxis protein